LQEQISFPRKHIFGVYAFCCLDFLFSQSNVDFYFLGFQEQAGDKIQEEKEKEEIKIVDAAALKEKSPMPTSN